MTIRYSLLALLVLLFALPSAQAQTNFAVTVISSTNNNPRPDPWPVVYAIDGVESAALTLVRGETYVFNIGSGANSHPFYISTSDVGGGAGEWTDGVTGNFATTGESVTFTVPMSAPDLLYYECASHPRMGWELNIVNPVSNEDEAQPVALSLSAAYPNPFAARTRVDLTLDRAQDVTLAVFDVAGRRVTTLHAGTLPGGQTHTFAFDATDLNLADGTYLVRATAGSTVVERRITLVR